MTKYETKVPERSKQSWTSCLALPHLFNFSHFPAISKSVVIVSCFLFGSLSLAVAGLAQEIQDRREYFLSAEFYKDKPTGLYPIFISKAWITELGLTSKQAREGQQLYKTLQPQLRKRLKAVRNHESVKEMSASQRRAYFSENGEKLEAIQLEIQQEFHQQYLDILLLHQLERIKDLIAQSQFNEGQLFGEYQNEELKDLLGMKEMEFNRGVKLAEELRTKFEEEVNQLYLKYHRQILDEFDEDSRQRVEAMLGDADSMPKLDSANFRQMFKQSETLGRN